MMTRLGGGRLMNPKAIHLVVLCAVALGLGGCSRLPSKGPLGAANIGELVERYKRAHRDRDVESLRAIYFQARFGPQGPGLHRMAGGGERYMPELFELDLADVEVVELAG